MDHGRTLDQEQEKKAPATISYSMYTGLMKEEVDWNESIQWATRSLVMWDAQKFEQFRTRVCSNPKRLE